MFHCAHLDNGSFIQSHTGRFSPRIRNILSDRRFRLLFPPEYLMSRALLLALLVSPSVALALPSHDSTSVRRESALFQFGTAVAINGDNAFVGEPAGPNGGRVHLY